MEGAINALKQYSRLDLHARVSTEAVSSTEGWMTPHASAHPSQKDKGHDPQDSRAGSGNGIRKVSHIRDPQLLAQFMIQEKIGRDDVC
jgi:hypothetical protein